MTTNRAKLHWISKITEHETKRELFSAAGKADARNSSLTYATRHRMDRKERDAERMEGHDESFSTKLENLGIRVKQTSPIRTRNSPSSRILAFP